MSVSLEDRVARCPSCKATRPSSTELPFFEYRGPGSREATESCMHCRYYKVAHDKKRSGERRLDLVCDNFEVDPNGLEFDTFYCGCRGWD